ncbi:MAG: nucleoside triphosphate pyrophosphatase [Kiritimatiellia bacterium]
MDAHEMQQRGHGRFSASTAGRRPVVLVLASGSPRRRKILADLGIPFNVLKTDAPERSIPDDPERTVVDNATAKLFAARRLVDDGIPILAADTIVWRAGRIYGKPRDLAEAAAFLRELGGKTHTVFTGLAYMDARGGMAVACERSDVSFRTLDEAAIARYVACVNPVDRAGAYDIDEHGDWLIERYTGTRENIMGLPKEPLTRFGIVDAAR